MKNGGKGKKRNDALIRNFALQYLYHLETRQLHDWFSSPGEILVIAGPCSAESEEQVMATAQALASNPGVHIFRAGIWKPRTRPGGFQGVGETGLRWLQRVRQETGLPVATEVAKPDHIQKALEYGIDFLWIGARTVVNPFSVQEIAESLRGVDIPVLVKNPIHPDLKLWIGAIERINQAGITRIIAVHRGFHYYQRQQTRNSPMWEIPIELKRLYPALPLICDPSHISGKRDHIFNISQKALDLEMNGLMIESHIDPVSAQTDSTQQLTPEKLHEILGRLVVRKTNGTVEFQSKLENLRAEIDKIDAELINILSQRMKIIAEIGEYKKLNNITILQIKRWREMIHERLDSGMKTGLNREFLLKLLELVHSESIQMQIDIMNGEKNPK